MLQTEQCGSLFNLMERHSISSASNNINLPAAVRPIFANNLSVSDACAVPMIPTSGAKTPITAHRVSSTSFSSGNRHW